MKIINRETLIFIVIFLITLFVFWPSFQLALTGDDWLAIWNYKKIIEAEKSLFAHIFTAYGPQDILMGLLSKVFGYEGRYYYITSFVLRMLAAISLYPMVNLFTKNKNAGLLSIFLFAITFSGLEATNWVFNMTAYIGIFFMNLSLYFLYLSRTTRKTQELFLSILFFFLANFVSPTRTTFLLLLIIMLDSLWVFENKKKWKQMLTRQLMFTSVFLLLKFDGNHINRFHIDLIRKGFVNSQHYFLTVKNSLSTLGSLIVPDITLQDFFSLPSNSPLTSILAKIGLAFLLVAFYLIYKFRAKKAKELLILGIALMTTGFITPQILWPNLQFLSSHRYLVTSAVGLPIFCAATVSLCNDKSTKIILYLSILFLTFLHINATHSRLLYYKSFREESLSKKIWGQLLKEFPDPHEMQPIVIYFESDRVSEGTVFYLIHFGFPPRAGIIYDIYKNQQMLPTPVDRFDDLVNIFKNGRNLTPEGKQDVPIDHIYAFRLEEKQNIKNITEEVRTKLRAEVAK